MMTTKGDLFAQLPVRARAYVWAIGLGGAALFAGSLPQMHFHPLWIFAALLLITAGTSTFRVHLPLPSGGATISLSYVVDFASLLLLDPATTMIVAATSALCQCTINSRAPTRSYRVLFSMASAMLTVRAAGLALRLMGGAAVPGISAWSMIVPLAVMAVVYFLVNSGLVATAIALSSRQSVRDVWVKNFLWSAPGYLAAAPLGAAAIAHVGYWLVPLAVAPLYLTYRTYRAYMERIDAGRHQVKQTAALHLATIEALARAIDAKDQCSYNHLWRVQHFAARLGEAIGLPDEEIQGIKIAALLHDIGMLAIPEPILSKPGPLTTAEFDKVRMHPQIGAELISGVPYTYPVAAAMLSHHERWDGFGYPHQLKGEAIPLGARILSIVDHFDSATSDRPYHKALDHSEGAELISRESGGALDPRLVTTFMSLLPALLAESAAQDRKTLRFAGPDVGSTVTADAGPVFAQIALAHREIYALHEIAQSMSASLGVADTMAVISSKLTKIVPWSGCSLFLYDPALNALTCKFGDGLDASRLLNRAISSDANLAGWVAGHPRQLVSADPRRIFESAGLDGRTALRSAMMCPLYFGDTFIGVFSVYHADADRYTEDHRRLFARVGELTGTVLHNSIVFESTQQDALTDQLTGLPNRRWLSRYLPQELSRAERPLTEVALISIDVDNFKMINDCHGHDVGDQALRLVGAALLAVCRPYDACARYSGDEFVMVLPDCSREAAEIRRRELQQQISEIVLPGARLRLAISSGVSMFPDDGRSCEALLVIADRRMYNHKASRPARGRSPLPVDRLVAETGVLSSAFSYAEAATPSL